MPTWRLFHFVWTWTPLQIALGLTLVSALIFVVEERRLTVLALLLQYGLLGLLMAPHLYRPVLFVRLGLGGVICLMLALTAGSVQRRLGRLALLVREGQPLWPTNLAPALRAVNLAGMGAIFRLVVMALGGLVAYNLWRTYPLGFVPAEINLASYWLISTGLLMVLTSADPLRMGLGLLTCLNGFASFYLLLEQGLVVISLMGVADVLIALGVVICAEAWLESLGEEEAAP